MRTGFDILAPLYDVLVPLPRVKVLARDLRLKQENRMLDLGGGTGRLASALQPYAAQVIVCDLSGPMLRRAARRGLTCVQARAERLPFPDGAFDRILIHDALHHFQDTESTLSEVARVLASAGMAVFEEPDVETRTGRFIAAAERMCGFRSRFLPSSALIALLGRQGLECRIVRRIGFRTRILARHATPS